MPKRGVRILVIYLYPKVFKFGDAPVWRISLAHFKVYGQLALIAPRLNCSKPAVLQWNEVWLIVQHHRLFGSMGRPLRGCEMPKRAYAVSAS